MQPLPPLLTGDAREHVLLVLGALRGDAVERVVDARPCASAPCAALCVLLLGRFAVRSLQLREERGAGEAVGAARRLAGRARRLGVVRVVAHGAAAQGLEDAAAAFRSVAPLCLLLVIVVVLDDELGLDLACAAACSVARPRAPFPSCERGGGGQRIPVLEQRRRHGPRGLRVHVAACLLVIVLHCTRGVWPRLLGGCGAQEARDGVLHARVERPHLLEQRAAVHEVRHNGVVAHGPPLRLEQEVEGDGRDVGAQHGVLGLEEGYAAACGQTPLGHCGEDGLQLAAHLRGGGGVMEACGGGREAGEAKDSPQRREPACPRGAPAARGRLRMGRGRAYR